MRSLSIVAFCLAVLFSQAQQGSSFTKFGNVTIKDLQKKSYDIDSGASSVILSDIGETAIEGNSKGWFSANFKRHRVIHILNKNGYEEAEMQIRLYKKSAVEEKLENIKAVTYNLENGQIVETKLNKADIFTEKVSDILSIRKFTMPAVKEGSIIEIQYNVTSDFIDFLDPWEFQSTSPTLWSEFTLSVPQFFSYAFLSRGYHPMFLSDKKNRMDNFTVRDSYGSGPTEVTNFTSGVTDFRWLMKDIPAIKEESFTSTIRNHLAAIDFQLSSHNPPLPYREIRGNWMGLTNGLLASESFGKNLSNNKWMEDELKPVIAGAGTDLEKAKKIYSYVRDNFNATGDYGILLTQSLKNISKTKKGSAADINLMLASLLKNAGLEADPIILSTRDNGYLMEGSPMLTAFNYVIVRLKTNSDPVFLDAANPALGFGYLSPDSYNGQARVVDRMATRLDLNADKIRNTKLSSVLIINNETGGLIGAMNQQNGYYESLDIRANIKANGKDVFFKDVEKDFGADAKISNPRIDSLKKPDQPVSVHYDFELPALTDDVIYINPMFGEGYAANPFKSAMRSYPVEMPYTSDETYMLTMDVPVGYTVDELPQQIAAKLDEQGSAYFEYRIAQSGSTISLRSRIKIDKTLFLPEEYDALREFFNLIVSKQKQQIVLKKKK